jgi:hypothetical protein
MSGTSSPWASLLSIRGTRVDAAPREIELTAPGRRIGAAYQRARPAAANTSTSALALFLVAGVDIE